MNFRCRLLTSLTPDAVKFYNDCVVTIDAKGKIGVVFEYKPDYPYDEDIRHLGVIIPGFVDAHVHFPQYDMRGLVRGELLAWLKDGTFPTESKFSNADYAREVAWRFMQGLASAGTTLSVIYSSVHPAACHVLFEVMRDYGARGFAGPVLMDDDLYGKLHGLDLPADQAIPELRDIIQRWHGYDQGRLRVAVIPRFGLSCTMDLMQQAAALVVEYRSEPYRLLATTHFSENPDECVTTCRKFGVPDYLTVYENAGLLEVPGLALAHCIHPSTDEWDRLQRAQAVVVHCPLSNDFLRSGRRPNWGMPIVEVLERFIPVTVGSDVGGGPTLSIPANLEGAFHNAHRNGYALSLERLFWWATAGGAQALSIHSVGQVAHGYEADMVLMRMPLGVDNAQRALENIIFVRDETYPLRTWVRGKEVWRRR